MPIKFSALTRPKSLESGEWVEWGHGLAFLIRPGNNKDRDLYVARRGVEEARRRALAAGGEKRLEDEPDVDFDPEASLDLQMEAVAHTVLIGWRGLTDDDGSDVPYSPEKAMELFRSEGGYQVYRQIVAEADRIARAALKVAQDAEGN